MASTHTHADNTAKRNEVFSFIILSFVFSFSVFPAWEVTATLWSKWLGCRYRGQSHCCYALCSLCERLFELLRLLTHFFISERGENTAESGHVGDLCVPDRVQTCSRVKGPVKITEQCMLSSCTQLDREWGKKAKVKCVCGCVCVKVQEHSVIFRHLINFYLIQNNRNASTNFTWTVMCLRENSALIIDSLKREPAWFQIAVEMGDDL